MAKIECYRPDGKMEMKEPVDAKECVENCGYTMEVPGVVPVCTEVVESEGTGEAMTGIEVGLGEGVTELPQGKKRGRKRNK